CVDDAGLGELRSRLLRWATDNMETLRAATPSIPEIMANRVADNWVLQFAIADLCGGDWGDKARAAALAIEKTADVSSLGVRLLADLRRIRDEDGGDAMHTHMIIAKLCEDQEAPWGAISRGKPITPERLANMLKLHGIRS